MNCEQKKYKASFDKREVTYVFEENAFQQSS